MRIEQIAYFLKVAEKRSITGAAKALYISQPALSKQISLLEEEVGVCLFERQARGVILTNAGRQFEKDLKHILRELENAKKSAALAGKTKKQLLKIGCFDGIYTDDFLPQIFGFFHHSVPQLKLVLYRMPFSEGAKALKENKVDLWLTLKYEWESVNGYCEKEIINRKSALIFSAHSLWGRADHVEFQDFQSGTFVTVSNEKGPGIYHSSINKMRRLGILPDEVEEVDNVFTVLSYLKLIENGFTILSEDVANMFGDLKHLILPEELGVSVLAVWDRQQNDLTQWMKEYEPK